MKSSSNYSIVIQWSAKDHAYVVTIPEWGWCHAHGATYEEAARNAQEVLSLLIAEMNGNKDELPTPHEFQYPGPNGFIYQFLAPVHNLKVNKKHAVA